MTLHDKIKSMLKDRNISKANRTTLKTLSGEFDRIDDGKKLSDEECISVIKKYIKNLDITLDIKYDENSYQEKMFLNELIPTKNNATKDEMLKTIGKVLTENTFKNNMQAMKPCIDVLDKKGYSVDKRSLSNLLKGF